VGSPLAGNVVILDDVITAGTSVRESVEIIRAENATPAGVVIALDRQEKGLDERSAIREVEENYRMPVVPIITLADIIGYLTARADDRPGVLEAIKAYRDRYGV